MRRPLSIMRAGDNWIELLFKVVGEGLELLGDKQPGDIVSVLGPIGQPFRFSKERPNVLLIGGGVGIPPMVFIADYLRSNEAFRPLAILGSEIPFPFDLQASQLPASWLDDEINSAMPLLEDWRVPSRLTSLAGFEGCFEGYVTDLAEKWLDSLTRAAAGRDRGLRLRPDADVTRGCRTGRKVRFAMPGVAGGVHGVCCWRLRRLCREDCDPRGAGDEARLCRRSCVCGKYRRLGLSRAYRAAR